MKTIARFLKDESGSTAIEYGMLVALISIAALTMFTAVGTKLSVSFTKAGYLTS
jgi:pilus assembly protein Flp/PilA